MSRRVPPAEECLGIKPVLIFLILFAASAHFRLHAADDKTKNSSTQQVGGLLFDMDEGVKIEHGPGGSVYVKSNKEYMEEKFKTIDSRLEALEKRAEDAEADLADIRQKLKLEKAVAAKPEPEEDPRADSIRKVLST